MRENRPGVIRGILDGMQTIFRNRIFVAVFVVIMIAYSWMSYREMNPKETGSVEERTKEWNENIHADNQKKIQQYLRDHFTDPPEGHTLLDKVLVYSGRSDLTRYVLCYYYAYADELGEIREDDLRVFQLDCKTEKAVFEGISMTVISEISSISQEEEQSFDDFIESDALSEAEKKHIQGWIPNQAFLDDWKLEVREEMQKGNE